ncbi:hypothetical protein TD95_004651 [Thielaviopsis punctulata]|uniref:N-terminal of MaoC-like dehydratase domain-containing protein n=1 Tax=Thielaviopsis punctulata TaxID=72032 RepID=A0A0F4ZLR2_9PEZI|nr:hypothetical protein TD95_004651 [Thielaviopsis punctulata]
MISAMKHLQSASRTLAHHVQQRYTSTAAAESLETIRARMLAQPAKLVDDYLTPTPSHLLSLCLYSASPHTSSPPLSFASALYAAPLLPGAHLVHFPIRDAPHTLFPDGTDATHLPTRALPKRMWEGGSVAYRAGWQVRMKLDGRRALCSEKIADVRQARGSGLLVDVQRRYAAVPDGMGAVRYVLEDADIVERRTLVFMPADSAVGSPRGRIVKCPYTPQKTYPFTPSDLMLFNFSALTYNAHKIHYTTGYDGFSRPVVHGPLTQALMLHVLSIEFPDMPVQKLDYSNIAPLFANDELTVCLARRNGAVRVWINGPDGGMAVRGLAVLEE